MPWALGAAIRSLLAAAVLLWLGTGVCGLQHTLHGRSAMAPAPTAPAARPPALQVAGGCDFGDGRFQPGDDVKVHGASNLAEGLRARIIAWDPAAALYVVRDADGQVWGLRSEKLQPLPVLELGTTWTQVHADAALPRGCEVRLDLATGARIARQADLGPEATASDPAAEAAAGEAAAPHALRAL